MEREQKVPFPQAIGRVNKKTLPLHVFSCEFWEILLYSYSIEHLRTDGLDDKH